jgi:rhodanese-related sulfurtransferase
MTAQFVLQNWYLFAGIVVVLFMLFGSGLIQRFYGVTQLPAARAVQLANRDSGTFLDVREPNEYAAGHIPKAVHIPLSQLAGRLAEIETLRDRPLIVYCRSGNRSGRAAVLLRRRGFESVHNLAGGILAWQGESLPLRKA